LFGFWGYEIIQWIEPKVPVYPPQSGDLPDGCWMQVDSLLIFDQVQRKIWAIAYADLRQETNLEKAYALACHRVQELVQQLQTPLAEGTHLLEWKSTTAPAEIPFESNTTPTAFCESVDRAREYIRAGDIFQVVLSQRLQTHYQGAPFALYRSLRLVNPSPYMAYFQFGDWQLIGSSPEIMVKAERPERGQPQIATVRPIAGTRKRGKTVQEDLALERDLLADPKECAEHVMLVDLGRNDLGRVCDIGSVQVNDLMTIERYSHVMHIVSNVIGTLAADKNAWDLLKACFPAGTVSGAPKIRAMEIIHELEGCRRGPYSGTYGYYDFEGQLNTAITIRTMWVQAKENHSGNDAPDEHWVYVQAGAGIVVDSQPEKEYEETLNKARGMLEAIRCLS
jgi:anthranilate synthase component 1